MWLRACFGPSPQRCIASSSSSSHFRTLCVGDGYLIYKTISRKTSKAGALVDALKGSGTATTPIPAARVGSRIMSLELRIAKASTGIMYYKEES